MYKNKRRTLKLLPDYKVIMKWEDGLQNIVYSKDLRECSNEKCIAKLKLGKTVQMWYMNKWYIGTILYYSRDQFEIDNHIKQHKLTSNITTESHLSCINNSSNTDDTVQKSPEINKNIKLDDSDDEPLSKRIHLSSDKGSHNESLEYISNSNSSENVSMKKSPSTDLSITSKTFECNEGKLSDVEIISIKEEVLSVHELSDNESDCNIVLSEPFTLNRSFSNLTNEVHENNCQDPLTKSCELTHERKDKDIITDKSGCSVYEMYDLKKCSVVIKDAVHSNALEEINCNFDTETPTSISLPDLTVSHSKPNIEKKSIKNAINSPPKSELKKKTTESKRIKKEFRKTRWSRRWYPQSAEETNVELEINTRPKKISSIAKDTNISSSINKERSINFFSRDRMSTEDFINMNLSKLLSKKKDSPLHVKQHNTSEHFNKALIVDGENGNKQTAYPPGDNRSQVLDSNKATVNDSGEHTACEELPTNNHEKDQMYQMNSPQNGPQVISLSPKSTVSTFKNSVVHCVNDKTKQVNLNVLPLNINKQLTPEILSVRQSFPSKPVAKSLENVIQHPKPANKKTSDMFSPQQPSQKITDIEKNQNVQCLISSLPQLTVSIVQNSKVQSIHDDEKQANEASLSNHTNNISPLSKNTALNDGSPKSIKASKSSNEQIKKTENASKITSQKPSSSTNIDLSSSSTNSQIIDTIHEETHTTSDTKTKIGHTVPKTQDPNNANHMTYQITSRLTEMSVVPSLTNIELSSSLTNSHIFDTLYEETVCTSDTITTIENIASTTQDSNFASQMKYEITSNDRVTDNESISTTDTITTMEYFKPRRHIRLKTDLQPRTYLQARPYRRRVRPSVIIRPPQPLVNKSSCNNSCEIGVPNNDISSNQISQIFVSPNSMTNNVILTPHVVLPQTGMNQSNYVTDAQPTENKMLLLYNPAVNMFSIQSQLVYNPSIQDIVEVQNASTFNNPIGNNDGSNNKCQPFDDTNNTKNITLKAIASKNSSDNSNIDFNLTSTSAVSTVANDRNILYLNTNSASEKLSQNKLLPGNITTPDLRKAKQGMIVTRTKTNIECLEKFTNECIQSCINSPRGASNTNAHESLSKKNDTKMSATTNNLILKALDGCEISEEVSESSVDLKKKLSNLICFDDPSKSNISYYIPKNSAAVVTTNRLDTRIVGKVPVKNGKNTNKILACSDPGPASHFDEPDSEEYLDGVPPFIREVFTCDNIRDGFINSDLVFVLSLLPDIEEMTDSQKMYFQLKVIDILNEVLNDPELKTM